jgi:5'-nucleotidase
MQITRQAKRRYAEGVVRNLDPRGRAYYWIGAGELTFQDLEGTDAHAIQHRMVSMTPLHLDLTNYSAFQRLQPWGGVMMPGESL